MAKIFIDGELVHNAKYEPLKVGGAEIEIEANQPGSLKFNVYSNHPKYERFVSGDNRFRKLKSIVEAYDDNDILCFRGRILENEDGFYKEKQVVCEGELAFLIDSKLRPYEIKATPAEIFAAYIEEHNNQMADFPEKQFIVGEVSELIKDGDTSNTDNIITRSSDSIVSVWEELSSKLIEALGGYLIVDSVLVEDDKGNQFYMRRINWLHEDDLYFIDQTIDFGENLLNIKINVKGDEIITALIPVGGEIETTSSDDEIEEVEEVETTELKQRLNITSIKDGVVMETEDDVIYKQGDFIYSAKGVEEYGLIFGTETWDDIVDTSYVNHLLQVGIAKLNEVKKAIESIEISAVDLSKIRNVSRYEVGTKVKVNSKVHGLNNVTFPITKINFKLDDIASNVLTLSKSERTFTETTSKATKIQNRTEEVIQKVSGLESKLANTEAKFTSQLEQTSEEIYSKVSEDYVLKEDHNELIESVNTEFSQTNEAFELKVNQVHSEVEATNEEMYSRFQEWAKYVRFDENGIILGETGNEVTLRIDNDRISFLQNGAEVAYFNNRKLYIVETEILASLKLGNYAYKVREDGSLAFGLVE